MSAVNREEPWLGPDFYTEAHKDVFKGREDESLVLSRLVERQQLTLLFGTSGLGKSSLLLAGLFPLLRGRGFLPVHVRVDYESATAPGEQILAALDEAANLVGATVPRRSPGTLLWQHFHRAGSLYTVPIESTSPKAPLTPVIVLDQFEELFTRGQQSPEAADRAIAFVRELADLIEDREPESTAAELSKLGHDLIEAGYQVEAVPFKVVISLREDFLAPLEGLLEEMPSLAKNRMRLEPLTVEQARRVVVLPAEPGRLLADGVADGILKFVSNSERAVDDSDPSGQAIARAVVGSPKVDPALLSIFCYELNRRRIDAKSAQISRELLKSNQEQILSGFYERAFDGLAPAVREFVEEKLVSPGGYRDSRGEDEAKLERGVTLRAIDILVARRLLQYQDRGTEPRRIELKHDVFVRVAQRSRDARRRTSERVQRNQRMVARGARWLSLGGFALIVLGLLGYHYLYVWQRTAYFAEYVEVFGEPRGIRHLGSSDVSRRPWSLRFTRAGLLGHVLRVDAVNHTGEKLTTLHDIIPSLGASGREGSLRRKDVTWRFVYDERGRVLNKLAYDREAHLVWNFVYSPESHLDKAGNEVRMGQFLGAAGTPDADLRGYEELTYQAKTGYYVGIRYFDQARRPTPRRNHGYGRLFTREEKRGAMTSHTTLGADGKPMIDDFGNAVLELELDEQGEEVAGRALDEKHQLIWVRDGWVTTKMVRDASGNVVERSFFGAKGERVRHKDGYHLLRRSLDEHGRIVREVYFDDAEKPAPTTDESGCYGYAYQLDLTGYPRETTCLGANGQPSMSDLGVAFTQYTRDGFGDVAVERYFDPERKAVNCVEDADEPATSSRYHRVEHSRDALGRVVSTRYFLASGGPATSLGYSRRDAKYDESDNLESQSYFDAAGAPAAHQVRQGEKSASYHRVQYGYDGAGRAVRTLYLSADGQPVLSLKGYAEERTEYDGHGDMKETSFFGTDGAAVLSTEGCAALTYERDQLGEVRRQTCLGLDRKPALDSNGVAGYGVVTDSAGNRIRLDYFGLDGKPRRDSDGVAGWRSDYDHAGRETRTAYVDTDGGPTNSNSGIHGWTLTNDAWGRELERRYFGLTGEPTVRSESNEKSVYAGSRTVYDVQGNEVETTYLGVNGKLMDPGARSCARTRKVFDSQRNALRIECYDAHGRPALSADKSFRATRAFDERGNLVQVRYFGRDGQPVACSKGYHFVKGEFGSFNSVTNVEFFDVHDKPTKSREGITQIRRQYDAFGHLIDAKGFVDGKPAKLQDGTHEIKSEVDPLGRVLLERYLDEQGKPFLVPGAGNAAIRRAYDAGSRETEREYLGVRLEPVRGPEGFARREWHYARDGSLALEMLFDEKGEPARAAGYARLVQTVGEGGDRRVERRELFGADGRRVIISDAGRRFAIRERVLDPYGQELVVSYFGTDGQSLRQSDGCSSWEFRYDVWGNTTHAECHLNGVAALSSNGFFSIDRTFNARGQLLTENTIGTDNKLRVNSVGFAQSTYAYDERGHQVERVYLDAGGKLVSSSGGYARAKTTFDGLGRQVSVSYYGSDGQLRRADTATVTFEYDQQDNPVLKRFADAKDHDELVERMTYDDKGQMLSRAREKDGKPFPFPGTRATRTAFAYDDWGRKLSEKYFDAGGHPTPGTSPSGSLCGETHFSYSPKGASTETCAPLPSSRP